MRSLFLIPATAAICIVLVAAPAAVASTTWVDAHDAPLLLDEDGILDLLRTARVVERKTLSIGINRTLKLTLEAGGARVHAAFRTVDQQLPPRHTESRPNRFTFRDSYRFEVAAYRLSRLFGLDRVPPTVLRTIDGEQGSVQLWVENASSGARIVEAGRSSLRSAPLHAQKQTMYVFDQLIYNFDRHLNNYLFDPDGRLWLIDHTRSFKMLPTLSRPASLITCDRAFLTRLRSTSDQEIKQELHGLLKGMELDAMMKRRRMILKRFDQLIADRGEEYVLYDLARESSDPQTLAELEETMQEQAPVEEKRTSTPD